nr:MAG TPA: hypothetical protein [Caudoviricetes sp.]
MQMQSNCNANLCKRKENKRKEIYLRYNIK